MFAAERKVISRSESFPGDKKKKLVEWQSETKMRDKKQKG
jgi:hypothetical protein